MEPYLIEFSKEVVAKNLARLRKQIWKMLPMKENNEDWMKQLNSVRLEVVGLSVIFCENSKYLILLSKLEGLPFENDFATFRKAVFDAISFLEELK